MNWYCWNDWEVTGSIGTKLFGNGHGRLDFGNCWNTGIVRVLLNGTEIASASSNTPSTIIEFDFDNVEGNVTYFSAIDGWTPSEIELYIGNGTRILEGYHNIFRCSFEKRIDVNNRNEPSSLDFHCKPRKCLFPDCEGKVAFVLKVS